jgi:hypothetical protein
VGTFFAHADSTFHRHLRDGVGQVEASHLMKAQDMSQTKIAILRQLPDADSLLVDRLSIIWDEVVDFIIQKMLDYCDPHVGDLHINMREEITLELAKLGFLLPKK